MNSRWLVVKVVMRQAEVRTDGKKEEIGVYIEIKERGHRGEGHWLISLFDGHTLQ